MLSGSVEHGVKPQPVKEMRTATLSMLGRFSQFGNHQERSRFAVNLALFFQNKEQDRCLLVLQITHHSGVTIRDLSGIKSNDPAL